jgi:hypothetical protein
VTAAGIRVLRRGEDVERLQAVIHLLAGDFRAAWERYAFCRPRSVGVGRAS